MIMNDSICPICGTVLLATEFNSEEYGDTFIWVPVMWGCPNCNKDEVELYDIVHPPPLINNNYI
jgi:hypothetical protein